MRAARGKISGRGACSAAAQPSPRPPRHRSKRVARSLSSAAQLSKAVLSTVRPSPHLPPPLSRRYRRLRSCRGARSAGTHTAVGLNRADRHSRSPRGRSTSGMRQPPRRRHTRGGRRERAPLLWLAPGEQASRSYQGVHDAARCRWQSCSSSPGMDEGPGLGVRRRLQEDVRRVFSPLPRSFGVAIATPESA